MATKTGTTTAKAGQATAKTEGEAPAEVKAATPQGAGAKAATPTAPKISGPATGEPDTTVYPTDLEPVFTKAQTDRLAKMEASLAEENEKLTDENAAIELQKKKVERAKDGRPKEAEAKKLKTAENATGILRKRITNLETQIAELKQAAIDKARANYRTKLEKEKAQEEKEARELVERGPMFDVFDERPLTDSERQRLDVIEAEMQDAKDRGEKAAADFVEGINKIRDEKLYIDHPGGLRQYLQDR